VQIEPFPVVGRVTRGGKPVHAEVRFASGSAVTTGGTGELNALLPRGPKNNLIDIRACDGSFRYVHIPKEEPAANQRLEIDVPVTSVSVAVSDAATGAPLADAALRVVVVKSMEDEAAYYSRTATTDESGTGKVEGIPPERKLIVCARKEGFDKTCITSPFELKADEAKQLAIRLNPAATHTGRLTGVSLPIRAGRLSWVSPEGTLLEETEVRNDGTFGYRQFHAAPASIVLVSASHPLTVFPAISSGAAMLELPVPQAPSRSFEVRFPADARRSGARLALVVGGVQIPTRAYVHHQLYHGVQPDIVAGRPVIIRDIAQTAPISVRFGPDPNDTSFAGVPDVFGNPLAAAAFPQVVVNGPVVELME
ncbi:MAG: carboxypeptidase-like regulatory domain-containing protein, partial [Acidobacteriota bacterium]|nr:carboxypeptidase-like regulatory domain-containing protein [Acidobacteriota bacterium]